MMKNEEAAFWGILLLALAVAYVGLGDCANGLTR